jgi:soluble lytic murein transglycosylase
LHFINWKDDDKAIHFLEKSQGAEGSITEYFSFQEALPLLERQKAWDEYLSLARMAKRAFPNDKRYSLNELQGLALTGRYAEAIKAYEGGISAQGLCLDDQHRADAYYAISLCGLGKKGGAQRIKRIVREDRDPDCLNIVKDYFKADENAVGTLIGAMDAALLRARVFVSNKDYGPAFSFFRGYTLSLMSPSAAIVSDCGKAWLYGNTQKGPDGAAYFSDLAAKLMPTYKDCSGIAWYYAGRCYLMAEKNDSAEKADFCFQKAWEYSDVGSTKDAAAWYLINGQTSSKGKIEEIAKTSGTWSSLDYFANIYTPLINELVSKSDFSALLSLREAMGKTPSPALKARLSYILERGARMKYVPPEIATGSFVGMGDRLFATSYYPIMEASLENVAPGFSRTGGEEENAQLPALASTEPSPEEARPVPTTAFLRKYFLYGLPDRLLPVLALYQGDMSVGLLREFAQDYVDRGEYGRAAKIMSWVVNKPGYGITRSDMELLYPLPYVDEVASAAKEFSLDPYFIYAVMRTESFFMPEIQSGAGAVGLLQLMPGTAQVVAKGLGYSPEEINLANPRINIRLGAAFLRQLINRFGGDQMRAVLAYNGGPTRVAKWTRTFESLPVDLFVEAVPLDETREYGRKVLAAMAVYRYLYENAAMRDTIVSVYGEQVLTQP